MTDANEPLHDRRQRLTRELLATFAATNGKLSEHAAHANPRDELNDLLTTLKARSQAHTEKAPESPSKEDRDDVSADKATNDDPGDAAEPAARRKLLLGLLGAGVAAGAIGGGAKEAKAQFGGGGGIDGLEDLVEIMLEFFELGPEMLIPTSYLELINLLLSMLDSAGPDSFSRLETIPSAFERSFPEEPPYTPIEQSQLVVDRSNASRARAQAALMKNAAVAEQQATFAMQEQAQLIAGQAGSSSGYGIIVLFQAMLALQATNNQRLGHLSIQLGSIVELLADTTMRTSNSGEHAVHAADRFFGGEGDDVAPIRSAPGG
ncbi:hypothetical protein [Marinivivus vitaminiproducens]|uniref:hypothetical protein n=1 Tax=Marinivivus vitaminiproducens TaxID=3035935 RepID=UPI0027A58C2D|nr:hypothetical protein P4R82_25095 [Geminicoccaceae bacterium SCSIO 64248]